MMTFFVYPPRFSSQGGILVGLRSLFAAICVVLPGLAQGQSVIEPIPSSVPVGVLAGEEATFHPEAAAAGLSATDWAGIRGAYEAGRHSLKPVDGETSTFTAWNPGQRWVTRFDQRGFLVQPRGEANWQWGLLLQRYGWGGDEYVVPDAPLNIEKEGQGLTYVWDSVVSEWFRNDQRGLEHGFTVWEKNSGASGGDPLHLILQPRGGLRPVVASDGQGVRFCSRETNRAVLTYDKLKVWDAGGRVLESRFEPVGEEGIRLLVDDEEARYPLTIDPIAQQAYLKASNTGAGDNFGKSVAISGDTVVVGASGESSAATGVNGNQGDDSSLFAGAAYVFVRNGSGWSQQAYLKAFNTGREDFFGTSVAISGDTVVVGASSENSAASGVNGDQGTSGAFDAGAVYVFVRSGSSWSQQAYIKASNTGAEDFFGRSVAISGETMVVGAHWEDSATTGVGGDQENNSAPEAGAAYVFVRNGGSWSQQAYLKASNSDANDYFGGSVAISGDTVVVGASRESSAATGVNGSQTDNSTSDAGATYVFVRNQSRWSQQAYLKASNTNAEDRFGLSVAISGDTVVVGTSRETSGATGVDGNQADNSALEAGAAYVFVRDSGSWSQQAYLKASNTDERDNFGSSVAISGDIVVVGARLEGSAASGAGGSQGNNGALEAGAAYVFVRDSGSWSQQAYLKASNSDAADRFGSSVAISGDTVVVGATGEDIRATGVNGNQTDDSAPSAGAAYLFSGVGMGAPGGAVVVSLGQTIGGVVRRTASIPGGVEREFIAGKLNTGGGIGNNWPANESPGKATDQILGDSFFTHSTNTGLGTIGRTASALLVLPSGGSQVVNQVTFYTAGNPLEADPSDYTIYGVTSSPIFPVPPSYDLKTATLLGSGTIDLPAGGRGVSTVRVENTTAYAAYVISFPNVRGPFKGVMRLAELSLERSGPVWNDPAINADAATVTLSATGIAGMPYKIQRSPDLRVDSWTTISTVTGGPGGSINAIDANPPAGKKFYRIIE